MEALTSLSFQEQYIYMAVPVGVTIVFMAILLNGMEFDRQADVTWYKKSIVETGTMTLFAVLCFIAYRFKIGQTSVSLIWRTIGASLVYGSLIVNILGRVWLKSNWSNQIRIKSEHTLTCTGPYRFVRHPLYTSTISMIYGAGIIYGNIAVIILNTIIFIPMMVYRASQEEKALSDHVAGYLDYKKRVPMLMPFAYVLRKVWRKQEKKEECD